MRKSNFVASKGLSFYLQTLGAKQNISSNPCLYPNEYQVITFLVLSLDGRKAFLYICHPRQDVSIPLPSVDSSCTWSSVSLKFSSLKLDGLEHIWLLRWVNGKSWELANRLGWVYIVGLPISHPDPQRVLPSFDRIWKWVRRTQQALWGHLTAAGVLMAEGPQMILPSLSCSHFGTHL